MRGKRVHAALASFDQWGDCDEFCFQANASPPADRSMMLGYAAFYGRQPLRDVSVNLPFYVELGSGVTVVGELDALGFESAAAVTPVIIEHKTTSSDITPGSNYWREVSKTNPQASMYALPFPGSTISWDAVRKPTLRQLEANSRRKEPETDEAYEARVLADMAERPGFYFQRATIVRLQHEHKAFRDDLIDQALQVDNSRSYPHPRNPNACHSFGRECDFFGVCWEGDSLDGPKFVRREKNHTEETMERLHACK